MADYSAMIRNTFEIGSREDAFSLFSACVRCAFPTNDYRGLELIRFRREEPYLEGKSMNHVFEIHQSEYRGHPVWDVTSHRISMGQSPDRHALLDYLTLDFIDYTE